MTFLAAAFIFILDRLTKVIAMSCLVHGQPVEVLRNIFRITLVLNTGTAFGLFKGKVAVFSGISVSVIVFIVVYILRNKKAGIILSLALGLILGGASGNLFDRIRFGYVIDFLDFGIWPVFNLADSAITTGVAILVLRLLWLRKVK
ncbi:MAG: signal peptidase II [Candidatus Omnitrophota bacterium]|nr:signal peptidase II [Candidatus Omnitrophota bacterium]